MTRILKLFHSNIRDVCNPCNLLNNAPQTSDAAASSKLSNAGQTLFESKDATEILHDLSENVGHVEVKIHLIRISRKAIFGINIFTGVQ